MYTRTSFFITVMFLSQFMTFTVSASVIVKAPKSMIYSGQRWPATFTFSPKLKSGEKVLVLIDNVEAMKFIVKKGEVEELTSHFRKQRSGYITVKRMVHDSVVEQGKTYVKINKGSTASGSPSVLDHSRIKERVEDGIYKSNIQTKNGFNNVLVLKDDDFELEIKGSKIVSDKSIIFVTGSFSKNIESSFKEKMQDIESTPRKSPISVESFQNEPGSFRQNEPNGFRGVNWDTDIKNYKKEFLLDKNSVGDELSYTRYSDSKKLSIGSAKLKRISYTFYKNKLSRVFFKVINVSYNAPLAKAFEAKFGIARIVKHRNMFQKSAFWDGKKVEIEILCTYREPCSVSFSSVKQKALMERDKVKADKESAGDF